MEIALVVLKYVDVLVWPTVVVIALWLFRPQIREAFGRVTRVKALGAEAEFSAGLAKSEELTAETTATLAKDASEEAPPVEASLPSREDFPLPPGDPTFSILSTWEALRAAVEELVETAVPQAQDAAWSIQLQELMRKGVTNRQFTTSVMELQRLRNQVAHGRYEPTEGQALTYVATGRELQRAAEVLRRKKPPPS